MRIRKLNEKEKEVSKQLKKKGGGKSMGHSNVTHFRRPAGAPPTDDVETFMRQCLEADTVDIITVAKQPEGSLMWEVVRNRDMAKWADAHEASIRTIPSHINTSPGHYGPWPSDGLVNMTK